LQTVKILHLNGATLPEDGTVLRNHTRQPARRTEHYTARFDRTTLYYDLVRHEGRERSLMTAPPLDNLWPFLRDGITSKGNSIPLKRRQFQKYEQIWLPDLPDLTLTINDQSCRLIPRADIARLFKDLNCSVTLNRDNDLDWIQSWARYHCRVHGLEGVLIFDNGSTTYSASTLAETLADVSPLRMIAVVSAPFPYGTTDPVKRGERRENYLQPALLNLARTDMLRHARAVLNVDIDEIVLSRNSESVFDRTVRSPFGLARLPVYWAHPAPGVEGAALQSAHTYRNAPKLRTPRKWCVRPDHGLGRLSWHVHHVGGDIAKVIPEAQEHEVVHCFATTTNWRNGPRHRRRENLIHDPELEDLMHRYFDAPR